MAWLSITVIQKTKAGKRSPHQRVVAVHEGQGAGCTPSRGRRFQCPLRASPAKVRSGRTGARQCWWWARDARWPATLGGELPQQALGGGGGEPRHRSLKGSHEGGEKDSAPESRTTADIRHTQASSRMAALSSVGARRAVTPGPETEPDGTGASPRTQMPETSSPTTAREMQPNLSCYRRENTGLTTSSVPRPTLPALRSVETNSHSQTVQRILWKDDCTSPLW